MSESLREKINHFEKKIKCINCKLETLNNANTYKLEIEDNILSFYENDNIIKEISLESYVNDEELFIQSGVLDSTNGIITFTRNDNTTFTVDVSSLFSNEWKKSGNNNVSLSDFIGSINNADVPFRTNNVEVARLKTNGNFGVGTNNPTEKLDVTGNIKIPFGKWVGWILDYVGIKFSNEIIIDSYQGVDININRYNGFNNGWFKIFNRINNVPNLIMQLKNTGEIRFPLISNATGDSTFTKQVVAKIDGTLGIIDKNENIPWISLPLLNSSKFTANSYVKYRVKDNTFCIHGHLTFNAGQNYTVGETICDLPYTLIPVFSVPNNSFMIPFDGGIINDVGVNQLMIEYRPAFSIYRLMFNQAISQSGFNMGTSFYYEIKL